VRFWDRNGVPRAILNHDEAIQVLVYAGKDVLVVGDESGALYAFQIHLEK
jgi:hypothetical protein